MAKTNKTFTVSIAEDYLLSLDDIWPDGDAPEAPTAEDVKAVMEDEGSLHRVLSDWCLEVKSLRIYGDQAYDQAELA